MNSSCFLVPIHPPKFHFGVDLIKSYNHFFNDDHFYFVFSSNEEETNFRNLTPQSNFRSLIATADISRGPINQKKYNGLCQLFDHTEFEHVAVIDCDCLFIKNLNYDSLFEKINESMTLNATYYALENWNPVIRTDCLKFFKPQDVEILKSITDNFRAYFWFNEIPIYNKKRFKEFVEYIDYPKIHDSLEWYNFDFIIYGYFLLLKGYAKLNILNFNAPEFGFLESQNLIPQSDFEQVFHNWNPMWIKNEILNMKNVFIKMHVDR